MKRKDEEQNSAAEDGGEGIFQCKEKKKPSVDWTDSLKTTKMR